MGCEILSEKSEFSCAVYVDFAASELSLTERHDRPDALFDRGYISFSDDGTLLISPRRIPYLRYHRDRIFLL